MTMELVDETAIGGMTSFLRYSRCLSHKLHDEMEALVFGDIELNKDGLDAVGRTLAQVEKNVSEMQSILSHFREIEKHARALNAYSKNAVDGGDSPASDGV